MEFFAGEVSVVLKTPLKSTKQAKNSNINTQTKNYNKNPNKPPIKKHPVSKHPSFNNQTQAIVS